MKRRAVGRADEAPPVADAAARAKALRFSIGFRRCCACGRLVGVRLWPWSGKLVVETHGYCEPCAERLLD
jgi:hypothetical protein